MKKTKILLIFIAISLFFTACQKDEIEDYDSISGVLTPGENVTAEDLAGIKLYLGKLPDDTDPASFTLQTGQVESAMTQDLNADGSFMFSNLANGNYVLLIEPGYTFPEDDYLNISIDGITEPAPIQQNVSRAEPDNTPIGGDPFKLQNAGYIVLGLDSITAQEVQIKCVIDNQAKLSNLKWNFYTNTGFYEITTSTYPINEEGKTTIDITLLDAWIRTSLSYSYNGEIKKFMNMEDLYLFCREKINDFEIEGTIKIESAPDKKIKVVFHKIGTGNYSITLSEV